MAGEPATSDKAGSSIETQDMGNSPSKEDENISENKDNLEFQKSNGASPQLTRGDSFKKRKKTAIHTASKRRRSLPADLSDETAHKIGLESDEKDEINEIVSEKSATNSKKGKTSKKSTKTVATRLRRSLDQAMVLKAKENLNISTEDRESSDSKKPTNKLNGRKQQGGSSKTGKESSDKAETKPYHRDSVHSPKSASRTDRKGSVSTPRHGRTAKAVNSKYPSIYPECVKVL